MLRSTKLIAGVGLFAVAVAASAGPRNSIYKHREHIDAATVSSAHDIPHEASAAGIPHLHYSTNGDPHIRNMLSKRERRVMQQSEAYIQAYEDGVAETLEDFRGKMNARQGFVWEPPVVEYQQMPSMVMNGALYPAHKTPVVVSPGRWVEANSIMLPEAATRHKTGRIQYVK